MENYNNIKKKIHKCLEKIKVHVNAESCLIGQYNINVYSILNTVSRLLLEDS